MLCCLCDLTFRDQSKAKVKYYELLKYASKFEILTFAIGIFLSACVGVSLPVSFIFFSDIVSDFASPVIGNFKVTVKTMAILGAVKFVIAFIQMFCLQYCARRQANKIRQLFYSVGINICFSFC